MLFPVLVLTLKFLVILENSRNGRAIFPLQARNLGQAILNGLLVAMGVREARLKPEALAPRPEPLVAGSPSEGRAPILALSRAVEEG